MNRLLALAAFACLLPVIGLARPDNADPEPPASAQVKAKEMKAMGGTFTVVRYVREGKNIGGLMKMKVVQAGGEWRFFVGEDIFLGKDSIDPAKRPKEVDSLYINGPSREKTARGIYKISADGNEITYCHADPGKDRPRAFDSGKEGSGLTLIVLRRQKE